MRRCYGAWLPLLAAVCAVSAAPPAGAQLFGVSQKDELDAGRRADVQIREKYHISSDPDLNGLVNHLGRRLAAVSERPNIPWTFRVVDSKEINAFSVPGYVYVNTGLINMVGRDQDALAGVIAHEIGHTTGRHAVKQAEQSSLISLLGGLIGGRNSTVGALANVAGSLVELGHSRGDENDADARAVRYTIRAGYDPEGLVRFFRMLQAREGRENGGLATYVRTHPLTSDRIRRVERLISQEEGQTGRRAPDATRRRSYDNRDNGDDEGDYDYQDNRTFRRGSDDRP